MFREADCLCIHCPLELIHCNDKLHPVHGEMFMHSLYFFAGSHLQHSWIIFVVLCNEKNGKIRNIIIIITKGKKALFFILLFHTFCALLSDRNDFWVIFIL